MKKNITLTIITELYTRGSLNLSALLKLFGSGRKNAVLVKKHLSSLVEKEIITISKGSYKLVKQKSVFKAEIKQVFRAHGFILANETNEEFFVPGKYLSGGVPGDLVLARPLEKESGAARVIAIIEESSSVLTGTIVAEKGGYYLRPDSFISEPLPIIKTGGNKIKEGDKVSFYLHERGERHSEHTVGILSVYGNAEIARVASEAYLDEMNIPSDFPHDVRDEAATVALKGISEQEKADRYDLRDIPIFTIDGADTKDIDDAISVKKAENGFELGVHIADVSYYVRRNSPLDKEALLRGTSVYIADFVIPMLPPELSNGICSLNPGEDRLAFSCLMKISKNGKLESYKFTKSVIKSRVQGGYSEVNLILADPEGISSDLKKKYGEVLSQLEIMKELAGILKKNRESRGAPMISSKESKIICDENGICIDIKAREGGISENIIEEFMLMANNAAASLAMENEIPFIYRVHEPPTAEKLSALKDSLIQLGIEAKGIDEKSTATDLSRVLASNANNERFDAINNLVLRSMMKAAYSPEPIGHFGLVMKEYAHFTSPIRRYPDLFIHRVLSDFTEKTEKDKLAKKYRKQSYTASARSSSAELGAINSERSCAKFYMAEYMKKHIGEDFDGVISGVSKSGVFVMLPNTVEGRISSAELTDGLYADFEVIDNVVLKNPLDGASYTVGDKIRVKCERISVSLGLIDFVPVK